MTGTAPVETDGVNVVINGTEIVARKGELIIAAAERNGVYIPRFCYHPRMESVGMCRMFIVEVDTGRFGPIGSALFLGARAYAVLGERTISFGTTQTFSDALGNDVETANFEVTVDPWLYRAHVGIRFQWLGLD